MKKQFTTAIEKKAFTFLVALAILFCSTQSFAAADNTGSETKSAQITYTGLKEKGLVFRVDYKNESAENFYLIIKNDENEIIYSRKYDAKPLSTDLLLSEVPDNCKLTFVIKSGKNDFSQSFAINTRVKTYSEFEVKGLN